MTWTAALVPAAIILGLVGLAGLVWYANRAGRVAERADARAGAEDLHRAMDAVDARPAPDAAALDDWLRRGSGGR
ncbi:hypothetical protein [Zavarzinia aquatilis]|uniref:hypothetical protein n=1 Tax=Zavarzinia aquatilis TaxID=2211142 RepID=UPI001403DAAC|nr:hypothetical protein [Zavarzinia aquatilis]